MYSFVDIMLRRRGRLLPAARGRGGAAAAPADNDDNDNNSSSSSSSKANNDYTCNDKYDSSNDSIISIMTGPCSPASSPRRPASTRSPRYCYIYIYIHMQTHIYIYI